MAGTYFCYIINNNSLVLYNTINQSEFNVFDQLIGKDKEADIFRVGGILVRN